MEQLAGFKPVGEVVADDRARIPFGKAGVRRDDRYAIAVDDHGSILLTPLASIPKRELLDASLSALEADYRTLLARCLARQGGS